MSEREDGSRARNTALSRVPVKEGIISHGLGVPMAGSRDVRDALSCHCTAASRTEARGGVHSYGTRCVLMQQISSYCKWRTEGVAQPTGENSSFILIQPETTDPESLDI